MQFNTDGTIRFTPVDKPYPFWHESQRSTIVQGGNVYANDGTAIQAYKNVGYDPGFNYDCHGLSFGGAQVWIDNSQVPSILRGDGYVRVGSPRPSDIAVYSNSIGVQHSAVVTRVNDQTGNVRVVGKGGPFPPEATPVNPGPGGGWDDPSATFEYFRMPTPATGASDFGASGGFLIYPNKPNNNNAILVYKK